MRRGAGPTRSLILDPTADSMTGALAYGATVVTLKKMARRAKIGYWPGATLVLAQDRPGGQEPEAVKDLIHTTAKEWKAAKPVTGAPQGEGTVIPHNPAAAQNPAQTGAKRVEGQLLMPDASELAKERASGPSGGGEGRVRDQRPRLTSRIMKTGFSRASGRWSLTWIAAQAAMPARLPAPPKTTSLWSVSSRRIRAGCINGFASSAIGKGTYPNVKARFMPIPCQHCDNAPLRAGLPGLCNLSQPGGPERDGLQPVCRDTLLRQQLPL